MRAAYVTVLVRVILVAVALLAPFPAVVPAFAQSQIPAPAKSFRELGYGDLTARTMHSSLNYFFPLPRGLVPREGSKLDLVISHSPLLIPERSTMTVVMNGRTLDSVFLTRDNAARTRLSIPLPIDGFVETGYFIQLQFAMRLTRDECEETNNPALWTTVHADSSATLPVGPSPSAPTLANLPGLFLPPPPSPPSPGTAVRDPAAASVIFVVPSAAGKEEIEAAGLAAYQVGRWAAGVARDPVIAVSRAPVANQPNIVIGSAQNLVTSGPWGNLNSGNQGFDVGGTKVPTSHGVLALARDGATPRLLVSGGSPEAVSLAADALTRTETRALLAREYVIVTGALPAPPVARAWGAGAASFAQLGIDRQVVSGSGEHIIDLFRDS